MKHNFFILITIFLCLFLTNSCDILERVETLSGGTVSNINITPNPTEGGSQKLSRQINIKGGEFICRRGFPLEERYDLDLDELNDEPIDSTESSDSGATAAAASAENRRQDNVLTTVADHWFKVGFNFQNKTEFHLIIERITFRMEANYGTEPLTGTIEINTSYCGANSEFIPVSALYIIPPTGEKDEGYNYKENLKNGINNLTIFVSGVPLPTGPRQSFRSSATSEDADEEPFILTEVPAYKVTAIFYGHLVNPQLEEQNTVIKKIYFFIPGYSFEQ